MSLRVPLICGLLSLCLAQPALAEWVADPFVNLSVADGAGDQVQVKIAPTEDGGAYLSWYDAIGNGFDVRVQKLDAAGNELFGHNGVLVADRSFSSTQDYGLDTDSDGNALLVFRDDSGAGVQITAAKVTAEGTLAWGPGNLTLTSTSDFVAAPKIAGASDSEVVVAWTEDVDVHVQRVSAAGVPLWTEDLVFSPSLGSYSASDLHDAGEGAILSLVHQLGGFGSPRHILAQKLDSDGASLWGTEPIAIFDSGSLQFGNFPTFKSDGSGGAVFSWYDAGSLQLQCNAQHVNSAGVEQFPHNGAAGSTHPTRVRVAPSVDYDADTGDTYLFWTELNSAQSLSGLYGQKFNASGVRQWTDNGVAVELLSSTSISFVSTVHTASGIFVYWDSSESFGSDVILGARVSPAGVIDIPTFSVGSTPSSKSRLATGESTSGFVIAAWTDDRVDSGDVLAQNVNLDGTLGGSTTGVDGVADQSARTNSIGLSQPSPNPSRGRVAIRYANADGVELEFSVFDSSGRLVQELPPTNSSHGIAYWNGMDGAGVLVASGLYFIRARNESSVQVRKVLIER